MPSLLGSYDPNGNYAKVKRAHKRHADLVRQRAALRAQIERGVTAEGRKAIDAQIADIEREIEENQREAMRIPW